MGDPDVSEVAGWAWLVEPSHASLSWPSNDGVWGVDGCGSPLAPFWIFAMEHSPGTCLAEGVLKEESENGPEDEASLSGRKIV